MTNGNHIRFVASLALVCLLAACASGTKVVLLPQEDGKPTAVTVRPLGNDTAAAEAVINTPYQRASIRSGSTSKPAVDQADPEKIKAQNASLFDMLPPKPKRYTLYFETGGTTLTAASEQTLKEVTGLVLDHKEFDVVVTGHTDTKGSLAGNDELSLHRAQSVRQMLIDQKINPAHIEAVGRGKRELAVPTADDVDEPLNRRVTVEIR